MTSIYLLFILSFTFINSIIEKNIPNPNYISKVKNSKVERFYNFGTKQKLNHNLRSSLLPQSIVNQIININKTQENISYYEMKGDYKINNYYGKVWKVGKLIYYEIFHSFIEGTPQKLKTETIDCNRKWYTLWIKEYCYKKTKRIFRPPNTRERKYIMKELMKESERTIRSAYPNITLNFKHK